MKEVWNERKERWQKGVEMIQELITQVHEDIDDYVCEYFDDARDETDLIENLKRLKEYRNKLFDTRNVCEENVSMYEDFMKGDN